MANKTAGYGLSFLLKLIVQIPHQIAFQIQVYSNVTLHKLVRYSLHPLLYSELKISTELLTDNSPQHLGSNLAKAIHPSLCPMLILLSRLKTLTIASESGDVLDPFLFMSFIRSCSTQSNLRVRVLASGALTGLISNEKLPVIMVNIVTELPSGNLRVCVIASRALTSLISNEKLLVIMVNIVTEILDDLIRILVTRSWIGSPKLCPCSTLNTSYLKLLVIMLSISRTCNESKSFDAICKFLWELYSECLLSCSVFPNAASSS